MKFYRDVENTKYPNYIKYFIGLGNRRPSNPVMLLFDNELADASKPVSKFCKKWLNDEQTESLREGGMLHIQDNIYMMVTPLVTGKNQTDIEMLFDEDVQEIEIDGRKLDKSGKKDKEKYFNKDVFSHYIMKNYKKINFQNFKPMLDDICKVMSQYKNDVQDDETNK